MINSKFNVINYNIRADNFNLITNKFKHDQLQSQINQFKAYSAKL